MAKAKPDKRAKPTKKLKNLKPVTARVLLHGLAQLQEQRGLDELVLLGALCEVIAVHQPTARQALRRIAEMLDQAGIR